MLPTLALCRIFTWKSSSCDQEGIRQFVVVQQITSPHSPYAVIRWKRYKEENKDEARELVDKLEVEGGQNGEQAEDEEE